MSGKQRICDGDWVCENEKCGNVNFARRSQCNRCGAEKSRSKIKDMGVAIGKHMAEKSHGLFSAEDWQCKTCGNVNWARRSDCNVCKMPKMGKVESRTGYGGGFNERENVEYNKREDSDDEFDEFGRKKKKFRGKVPTPPRLKEDDDEVQKEVPEEEEEEEDDNDDLDAYKLDSDEEEDGGDLNKYDLSSDDDKDQKEKKPESTVAPKASRSPSRSSSRSSSTSGDSRKGSQSGSSRSSRSRSGSRSDSRSKKRRRSSSGSRSPSSSRSRSPRSAEHFEHKKRR